MNRLLLLVSLLFFFSTRFLSLFAQEEQLAIYPGVFEINKQEALFLSFFKNKTEGFKKAHLYSDEQLSRFFKVQYSTSRGETEKTIAITKEELDVLRNEFEQYLTVGKKDQSGRYYFITSLTANSIAQGSLLGNLFYTEYSSPFGSSYREKSNFGAAFPFIASAGAFAGSLVWTKDKEITRAMANAHFFSSVFGYYQGALLSSMVIDYNSNNYETGFYVLTGLTSLAAGWTAYGYAKSRNASYEQTVAWNTGNFWGALNTGLLSVALDIQNDVFLSGLILAGSLGGIVGMNQFQNKWSLSTGDYRAMNALGVSGLTWGAAISESADFGPQGTALFALLGGTTGIIGGKIFPRQGSFSKTEGSLISLGTFLGGAFGGAVTAAFGGDYPGFIYSLAIGSSLGWISTALFLNKQERGFGEIGFLKDSGVKMNVSLNPMGLGMRKISADQQLRMMNQNVSMSIVNCKLAF